MNATEARALTEARLAESDVDYVLRTKVYPAIRAACECQRGTVTVKGLYQNTIKGVTANEEVATVLRAQSYTVRAYDTKIDGPSVEVSW